MSPKYTIGVDFGTLSGRAVLVRVSDGAEIASAVSEYSNGVIDERLPRAATCRSSRTGRCKTPTTTSRSSSETIPAVLQAERRLPPDDVIGIGIDFTACTMLPTKADGTPLCCLPEWRSQPARLGEAVEAPRRAARGQQAQRDCRLSAARRGCRATAARSPRSGSFPRRCKS